MLLVKAIKPNHGVSWQHIDGPLVATVQQRVSDRKKKTSAYIRKLVILDDKHKSNEILIVSIERGGIAAPTQPYYWNKQMTMASLRTCMCAVGRFAEMQARKARRNARHRHVGLWAYFSASSSDHGIPLSAPGTIRKGSVFC